MERPKPSREKLNERIIEADAQMILYGTVTGIMLGLIAWSIKDIANSDTRDLVIGYVIATMSTVVFSLLTGGSIIDGNEAKNSALEAGFQVKRPFPFVIRHVVEPLASQNNHNLITPQ